MPDTIISVKNASFRYEGADNEAVNDISLDISSGEFVAVLGKNGSGKSTLAKMLNALIVPSSGSVKVNGISPDSEDNCYLIRTKCGMVFQNPDNQIVSTIVEEDCAFGLENMGVEPTEIRRRVDSALETVGMSSYAMSAPHMLSGGQKQRIAIAGVVAMRPDIMVFDESTAMLDPVGRKDIFSLAKRLNKEEGITIIWITHFMDEAAASDRVCVIDKGKMVIDGSPREVFSNVDKIREMGLDVPEMARLKKLLTDAGVTINGDIMTVDEMAVELCRLK